MSDYRMFGGSLGAMLAMEAARHTGFLRRVPTTATTEPKPEMPKPETWKERERRLRARAERGRP